MKQIDKWIEEVFQHQTRKAVPIMTHPGIELCGKTVKDAVTNGAVHADAIIRLNEKYPAGASTVIMDLTVEAEAFGAEVIIPEDDIPYVTGRLVTDFNSVQNLEIPPLTSSRVPEYLKANRISSAGIANKPVFAGCIGPFSLAARLFDLTEMLMAIYLEPETITLLLEKCTQFLVDYCRAIKETGVQGLIIAEPAAGLVSNDDCKKYSTRYVKEMVKAVQDKDFLVVLHNCGNSGHCTQAMIESGAQALHFGNKITITEALDDCPENILVMGNLDPVGLLKQSTAKEVFDQTLSLLNITRKYPNFILSTGCDVPPHIPQKNIESFYDALRHYNENPETIGVNP